MSRTAEGQTVDVALIGGGIMSATAASLLASLSPGLTVQVFERLEGPALESSEAMNNAGTGHAANCELNYTPQKADGSIDISKALSINASFERSLDYWSTLVEAGRLPGPSTFIRPVPHLSFVWGETDVAFLRARHALLAAHPMFTDMAWSQDPQELQDWMPLVMTGRPASQPVAATRVARGTDVDFGRLTRLLLADAQTQSGCDLLTRHEVRDLQRHPEAGWILKVQAADGGTREVHARFVFIGAGGGSLPLLLKSGIPEGRGYGGMSVSGQWLVCTNPGLMERHHAKVYGKASVGAPPMSVPHLDTRVIDGKPALLFGPFAGFTTRFLKQGSLLDMPGALRPSNLWPMTAAALHNLDLTRYLVGQVLQSHSQRVETLRDYFPMAQEEDWQLAIAGQRVQIVKRDEKAGGKLEFGTEVVAAEDGSLAALLGASPGASTAVTTMTDMLLRCFPDRAAAENWRDRLRQLIPSCGSALAQDPALLTRCRERNTRVLGLG